MLAADKSRSVRQPCVAVVPYDGQVMNSNEAPLRETIAEWLREQGHIAVVEAADARYGEIFFKARGLRFTVRVDENDRGFLFLLLPSSLPEHIVDELLTRRATAAIESNTKVVKVDVQWESRRLVFSAEQLVTEPGGPSIFWRSISLLEQSFRRIWQTLDEETGRAAASTFTAQLEAELATEDAP
jgi:hypothetical protein